jgi:hypothetical protein
MTLGDATFKRSGRAPEARVRWLLRFASQDVTRLSPAAQRAAWDRLFELQSRESVRVPLKLAALIETHRELRGCIEALANGRPYDVWVPGMSWSLRPPTRRPAGARHSAPVVRESAEARVMSSAMPAMAVLALVDDLNAIDADRLRACPLETHGRRCAVVFLGTRGQKYCTPTHAQAAAWQTYLAKPGAEQRKLRRKG